MNEPRSCAWGLGVLALLASVSSSGLAQEQGAAAAVSPAASSSATSPRTAPEAVLVGAGDIGYCSSRNDERTGRLLDDIPGTVFTTGDNGYPAGADRDYSECYAPGWGRQLSRTRPSPGNHDYDGGGDAYHRYFGASAGPVGKGYYSYDLGSWHVVALNSTLTDEAAAAQLSWLADDLERRAGSCVLAYWHHPLFGSGVHSSSAIARDFWELLEAHGAELVINGHDHIYERFARQTVDGERSGRGIREFIVGTGGADLHPIEHVAPLSEVRSDAAHGVLRLQLFADHYAWDFIPIEGDDFTDSGTNHCTPKR